MVLEKYEEVAGFNVEGYYFSSKIGIQLEEFIPSLESFETLPAREGFMGVAFIFDNIAKLIYVFKDKNFKGKKIVKAFLSQANDDKLTAMTAKVFENELKYDIQGYEVKNALKFKGSFYKLFKYQLNEYPLYNKHYVLPQFENMIEDDTESEQAQADVSTNIKTCANCGWILSSTLTVCPKCKRSPREKFEENKKMKE